MTEFVFILSGLFVGTIVGLTGVGGGSLMTPILILFLGIKPHIAVGTDLLFSAFTKMSGTVKLARDKTVDWRIVGLLILGSVPATLIILVLIEHFGTQNHAVKKFMLVGLGIALILTAAATLYKVISQAKPKITLIKTGAATKHRHWILTVLFGAIIGALVTLTSVGAGAIGVVVLTLLYPATPLRRIIASDIAYAVPLTLVAGLGHASMGSVDLHMLVFLLIGSIPGIWIGAHLISRIPERWVRGILSILLFYVGSKLLMT